MSQPQSWDEWAEQEAARLEREEKAGWDAVCEREATKLADAAELRRRRATSPLKQLDEHLEN